MNVLSIRLGEEELRQIKILAKEENEDRSHAARELIREGWKFHLFCMYRDGRLSLDSLEYEDYLQGLDFLKNT